jgi:hypothetical protein
VTQADRDRFQAVVRGAAVKAARNPSPCEEPLLDRLLAEGMAWLDDQANALDNALFSGTPCHRLTSNLWRLCLDHLLEFRKSRLTAA